MTTVAASEPPAVADRPAASSSAPRLLTVVDKQRSLPAGYVPPDLTSLDSGVLAPGSGSLSLREEAAAALSAMLAAARAQTLDIRVASAYRSYAEQVITFDYWVSVLGEEEARRVSAEAGHSEHQLGTTVDVTDGSVGYELTEAFGATAAGHWLQENAHLYGFALSYPAGAEAITGYAYEPWHFRYIGPDHALAWRQSGVTLVEYLRSLES